MNLSGRGREVAVKGVGSGMAGKAYSVPISLGGAIGRQGGMRIMLVLCALGVINI